METGFRDAFTAAVTRVSEVCVRQLCTLLLSANQYRRSSSCSAARHACLSLSNARFSKKHLGGASRSIAVMGEVRSRERPRAVRRFAACIVVFRSRFSKTDLPIDRSSHLASRWVDCPLARRCFVDLVTPHSALEHAICIAIFFDYRTHFRRLSRTRLVPRVSRESATKRKRDWEKADRQ